MQVRVQGPGGDGQAEHVRRADARQCRSAVLEQRVANVEAEGVVTDIAPNNNSISPYYIYSKVANNNFLIAIRTYYIN